MSTRSLSSSHSEYCECMWMHVRTEAHLSKINILGRMFPAKNHEYLYLETVPRARVSPGDCCSLVVVMSFSIVLTWKKRRRALRENGIYPGTYLSTAHAMIEGPVLWLLNQKKINKSSTRHYKFHNVLRDRCRYRPITKKY